MRLKNSGAANRILETPGELFAAAQGENALILQIKLKQPIKLNSMAMKIM